MNMESRTAVLLISVLPEAHASMLEALRQRGIPAEVARSGKHAVRKLRRRPVLVLVDLTHGPSLDRHSIERLNATRRTSTVLALHDGDLAQFADELEDLVVDGFCRVGEWVPIVELAAENIGLIEMGPHH